MKHPQTTLLHRLASRVRIVARVISLPLLLASTLHVGCTVYENRTVSVPGFPPRTFRMEQEQAFTADGITPISKDAEHLCRYWKRQCKAGAGCLSVLVSYARYAEKAWCARARSPEYRAQVRARRLQKVEKERRRKLRARQAAQKKQADEKRKRREVAKLVANMQYNYAKEVRIATSEITAGRCEQASYSFMKKIQKVFTAQLRGGFGGRWPRYLPRIQVTRVVAAKPKGTSYTFRTVLSGKYHFIVAGQFPTRLVVKDTQGYSVTGSSPYAKKMDCVRPMVYSRWAGTPLSYNTVQPHIVCIQRHGIIGCMNRGYKVPLGHNLTSWARAGKLYDGRVHRSNTGERIRVTVHGRGCALLVILRR